MLNIPFYFLSTHPFPGTHQDSFPGFISLISTHWFYFPSSILISIVLSIYAFLSLFFFSSLDPASRPFSSSFSSYRLLLLFLPPSSPLLPTASSFLPFPFSSYPTPPCPLLPPLCLSVSPPLPLFSPTPLARLLPLLPLLLSILFFSLLASFAFALLFPSLSYSSSPPSSVPLFPLSRLRASSSSDIFSPFASPSSPLVLFRLIPSSSPPPPCVSSFLSPSLFSRLLPLRLRSFSSFLVPPPLCFLSFSLSPYSSFVSFILLFLLPTASSYSLPFLSHTPYFRLRSSSAFSSLCILTRSSHSGPLPSILLRHHCSLRSEKLLLRLTHLHRPMSNIACKDQLIAITNILILITCEINASLAPSPLFALTPRPLPTAAPPRSFLPSPSPHPALPPCSPFPSYPFLDSRPHRKPPRRAPEAQHARCNKSPCPDNGTSSLILSSSSFIQDRPRYPLHTLSLISYLPFCFSFLQHRPLSSSINLSLIFLLLSSSLSSSIVLILFKTLSSFPSLFFFFPQHPSSLILFYKPLPHFPLFSFLLFLQHRPLSSSINLFLIFLLPFCLLLPPHSIVLSSSNTSLPHFPSPQQSVPLFLFQYILSLIFSHFFFSSSSIGALITKHNPYPYPHSINSPSFFFSRCFFFSFLQAMLGDPSIHLALIFLVSRASSLILFYNLSSFPSPFLLLFPQDRPLSLQYISPSFFLLQHRPLSSSINLSSYFLLLSSSLPHTSLSPKTFFLSFHSPFLPSIRPYRIVPYPLL
ncbi:hypothetical protein C7M84_013785 [Penaeus vannamei]|uniref:Uncharacterized protein n=1 Tax=Penaeus vannamei TaxID=6689 RepID=A0A423SV71_PENVA|nr:hypothetical protein C7M84_013785 [Penaeus vannamei]